jgi:diamine N-acetyltransferase
VPKSIIAPIQSSRLRLRLAEAGDLPLTLAWRNQDEIRRWFKNSNPLTLEQHQAWFSSYLLRDDDYLFLIEETDRLNRPIGQVSLYGIDWQGGSAEFGRILIGEPEAQGAGLAGEATTLLLDFAFREWGLREIYLEVIAENARALRVYRRCGFVISSEESGLIRMHVSPERLALLP